jgi:hypothetical protein
LDGINLKLITFGGILLKLTFLNLLNFLKECGITEHERRLKCSYSLRKQIETPVKIMKEVDFKYGL